MNSIDNLFIIGMKLQVSTLKFWIDIKKLASEKPYQFLHYSKIHNNQI